MFDTPARIAFVRFNTTTNALGVQAWRASCAIAHTMTTECAGIASSRDNGVGRNSSEDIPRREPAMRGLRDALDQAQAHRDLPAVRELARDVAQGCDEVVGRCPPNAPRDC